MKHLRFKILRTICIVALILFYLLGLTWRAQVIDSGLAAYQQTIKKPDVSVSISEEGHVVKVEGVHAPGQVRPCSATLRFD